MYNDRLIYVLNSVFMIWETIIYAHTNSIFKGSMYNDRLIYVLNSVFMIWETIIYALSIYNISF